MTIRPYAELVSFLVLGLLCFLVNASILKAEPDKNCVGIDTGCVPPDPTSADAGCAVWPCGDSCCLVTIYPVSVCMANVGTSCTESVFMRCAKVEGYIGGVCIGGNVCPGFALPNPTEYWRLSCPDNGGGEG